jgi:hypothetical protein
MPDEKLIYDRHARQYDLLLSRADYQQNIPQAVRLAGSHRFALKS